MERNRPLEQVYSRYTPEDFKVWKKLFERQSVLLDQYGSSYFGEALKLIGFTADDIPEFNKVNERLSELTGWKLAVVPGHVPPRDFFEMLGDKIFPATCWLRTLAELDYVEEPDMFHDVFGHVPLLVNKQYSDFMQAFGKLALTWHDEPYAIELLSRIYWFTIEFGLIREAGGERIYGAGILSSPGETQFSMSEKAQRSEFNTRQVLETTFRTDTLQEQYFTISGLSQLAQILPEVKLILLHKIGSHSSVV